MNERAHPSFLPHFSSRFSDLIFAFTFNSLLLMLISSLNLLVSTEHAPLPFAANTFGRAASPQQQRRLPADSHSADSQLIL
jgi:hypothetical protein